MTTKFKPRGRRSKISDTYLKLVIEFPLASIKSEEKFAAAQLMIDRLLTKGKLDAGEKMYLDALSDLVAAYEDVHYPIPPASDADLLRHLMEIKGVTHAELHRQTGIPKTTILEILEGKKNLNRSLIRILADFFQVDSSVLTSNLKYASGGKD